MVIKMEKKKELVGKIHTLETFGSVDGPGVRFVVFLQGCAMRCQYCHNPETWSMTCGQEWTPEALVQHIWRYRSYWGKDGKRGGVTVSGGEPLLQLDFVTAFFRLCREKGIHTALDTSGQPFRTDSDYLRRFDELLSYTDLVILDLKEMDEEKHKRLTGQTNRSVLQMASYLSDHNIPLWIRHVLVPGLTDSEEGLVALRHFIEKLNRVERVELLPYHTLGLFKWEKLSLPYPLVDACPPTEEEMLRAKRLLGIS
jgi:pyruvate formate lyase activating enzyme